MKQSPPPRVTRRRPAVRERRGYVTVGRTSAARGAPAANDQLVRLPDGRRVALVSHGDARGSPLFVFHGVPASRLGHGFTDGPAGERGVRVLSPDRPGVGLSDPKPGRTISGYAEDVGALADALGLGSFAVLGYSGGGPYALACGAKLPGRVTAVCLMAGVGPLDRPGAREGMDKTDLVLTGFSLRRPLLARMSLTAGASARFAPSLVLRGLTGDLHESDRWFLEEERQERGAAGVMRFFVEAFRQGAGGMALEYRLCGSPWGFSPGEVAATVRIWQGEEDRMEPPHHAEDVASRLPRSSLRMVPGAGHFSITRHFGAMLGDLATVGAFAS